MRSLEGPVPFVARCMLEISSILYKVSHCKFPQMLRFKHGVSIHLIWREIFVFILTYFVYIWSVHLTIFRTSCFGTKCRFLVISPTSPDNYCNIHSHVNTHKHCIQIGLIYCYIVRQPTGSIISYFLQCQKSKDNHK